MNTKTKPGSNGSLSSWRSRSLHTVGLPSGQIVKIRVPGIATLIENGEIPEDLIDIALEELTEDGGATAAIAKEVQDPQVGRERVLARLAELGSLQRSLVRASVVEIQEADGSFVPVELSEADVGPDGLPEDDLAMVAEIVQRVRGYDARGVRIGVEPLDRWAAFHREHGLDPEDCEHCQRLSRELSSIDVGAV